MKKLVIETNKLKENIETIQSFCQGNTLIAVVKGDGYGLSLIPYSAFLLEQGITHFAVSEAKEAIALKSDERFANATVLLLTPENNPQMLKELMQKGVTLTVGATAHLDLIATVSKEAELAPMVHIKVDTGFGRFGFSYRNEQEILDALECHGKTVQITGIFTHYSCSFEPKYQLTKIQDEQFDRILAKVNEKNPELFATLMIHSANSCGALLYPNKKRNAVRIGSAFLGRLPMKSPVKLHRLAYLEVRVLDVNFLKKGDNVAYGNTYTAKEDISTAVIGIGYKDGFGTTKLIDAFRFIDILRYIYTDLRSFGKKNYLYQGKYEILGRVGMYCAIVKNDGSLHVNDIVKADCNPLLIDSSIPREYR
ncbi:MAG: alanine racemase [Clostridia bacterium]|nr:alanine racemase [Clostridia bacterium]